MSVAAFLLLVFVCLAVVGVTLTKFGYRKVYLALSVCIAVLFAISVIATWRPSTDDPIPSLMFLVIGVYGSLSGAAGMLVGLIFSKVIETRSSST